MKKKLSAERYKTKFILEELEPRKLFSGGVEGLVNIPQAGNNQPIQADIHANQSRPANTVPPQVQITQAAQTNQTKQQEVVFVDANVKNYQELVKDILGQKNDTHQIEVILLNNKESGLDQIEKTLVNRSDVSAIHLIGEGNKAELHLGNSFLNQESISGTYADSWRKIGKSLSADSDILSLWL